MVKKQTAIKTFMEDLPKNIFSGFVVSLIALPLGLGLAIASEAPPIAGIISAVVSGVMVAILGGSNVTITGPGNGLVVVLLSAITTLALGDIHQGFLYTLAAIVISGGFMLVLGFLRMGILSDFFPSSAIQGMLAAIGIGIFAKQFHVMLGYASIQGNTVDLLLKIPDTLLNFFTNSNKSTFTAGEVGIVSLLIMIYYPKIRNRIFQLIPAPMWIVVLTVGMSYYFNFISPYDYPIDKALLISIPENVLSNLAFPDFRKIFDMDFVNVVIAITLVSSIESLLSVKAVDKLDPLRRRSNINQDLKALGFATMISGFLGGLNVVTVIARSSVNVNNGATNRSSNFFHAGFLLIFVLLFQNQLRMIPLPALAAILVFTGYKLAAPKNIAKIFKIGKEQLLIFLTTLLVTIFTNLITGIICGIAITFVIHIVLKKSIFFFTRNVLKPNVLMFKEADEKQNYYVSVVNFCSFLNYSKLKSKLDQIPENQDVIVDFSRCSFVDHTVMENLNNYIQSFNSKGGHFEVIGLDLHGAHTGHPFALRRISATKRIASRNLTKRQKSLKAIAKDFHWTYRPIRKKPFEFLKEFSYFETKNIDKIKNVLKNDKCTLFDVIYTEGEFIAKQVIRSTMIHIQLDSPPPQFTLDREGMFEYIYHLAGYDDLDIEGHPDFSKRFFLYGNNKKEIEKFFTDELVLFFESNTYYHIKSGPNGLLILHKERLASVKEIKAMGDFATRLLKIIEKNNSIK
ncbi:SulP family inorganic anion transporter [Flavicella sediminum]|uniref:SulP family inorganic anion transporter n=1 Tax=Flavicella sediminum TaxID=2585141 RepID=UPI00111FBF53|nr:SulP family inorganic anion transporter [Flavicella sediminum]